MFDFADSGHRLTGCNRQEFPRRLVEHLRLRVEAKSDEGLQLWNAAILPDNQQRVLFFFNAASNLFAIDEESFDQRRPSLSRNVVTVP